MLHEEVEGAEDERAEERADEQVLDDDRLDDDKRVADAQADDQDGGEDQVHLERVLEGVRVWLRRQLQQQRHREHRHRQPRRHVQQRLRGGLAQDLRQRDGHDEPRLPAPHHELPVRRLVAEAVGQEGQPVPEARRWQLASSGHPPRLRVEPRGETIPPSAEPPQLLVRVVLTPHAGARISRRAGRLNIVGARAGHRRRPVTEGDEFAAVVCLLPAAMWAAATPLPASCAGASTSAAAFAP